MFSGSVGKTYVASLVLKLQEQGKLNIRDKAGKYLNGEDWFRNVPNANDITLEMLLNHTAGVPEYVYDPKIWQILKDDPDKSWSVEERLSYISGKPPANAAGRDWSYADSHYLLLGLIIEKVTSEDYYEVLSRMILKPYHLNNTRPALGRSIAGLVPGYTALSEELLLPEKVCTNGLYAFNPQLEWTGGGLVTTVTDLSLWASELYGGKVIGKASLEMMETPAPYKTTLVENAGYGLGCFVGNNNGHRYFGHTGFVPGYITILHYLPDEGIAIAMQINSDKLHGKAATDLFNVLKSKILVTLKD
jgi:D-alanyl-D-alanine carboxypeptidase